MSTEATMTAGWCGNKGARPPTSLEVARRGKMILIESCLSSIPNYIQWVHIICRMRYISKWIRQFLLAWHHLKKYYMDKWEIMVTPKKTGGASFTDTRVMNKCLLAKWIVKIERGDDNLCCNLLRQNYL
jgi:hypothetical protein